MRKLKEVYYCDRCFEEIPKEKMITQYEYAFIYQLCEKCSQIFNQYKNQVSSLDRKYDNIQKAFKFGRYLPKPKEDVNE